jgi:flagellar biosynthesis/type III secretory pathway protein FliH
MKAVFICLALLLCAVPLQAQKISGQSINEGVKSFLDSYERGERLNMEKKLADQQLELMRLQAEAMKQEREAISRNKYEKAYNEGFKEGQETGYKKGTDDFVEYMTKNMPEIQYNTINNLGKSIFEETSRQKLMKLKTNALEFKKQYPNNYLPRVYLSMIDVRLKELGYAPKRDKKR